MILDTTKIEVVNRTGGSCGYTIPELNNLRRRFTVGETKQIEMGELRKLSWIPGGKQMLRECLAIQDKEAIAELLGEVEPEYNYSNEQVKELLLNGSLDSLKDAIDFAPTGVVELIKQYAVELKINDIEKRDAILEMTGFDVSKAIEINKMTVIEAEQTAQKRRTETAKEETPAAKSATPKRRVVTTK